MTPPTAKTSAEPRRLQGKQSLFERILYVVSLLSLPVVVIYMIVLSMLIYSIHPLTPIHCEWHFKKVNAIKGFACSPISSPSALTNSP